MITTNLSPLTANLHDNVFELTVSGLTSDSAVIRWNDGYIDIIEEDATVEHTYQEFGEYTVVFETCDLTATHALTVLPFINQFVEIVTYSATATAGCGVEIEFRAFSFDEISTFSFYSSASNSGLYTNPPTFWSHLEPSWYFTDEDGNVISSLEVSGNPYYDNDNLVGYTLTATVFYYDSLPGNPTIIITKESK